MTSQKFLKTDLVGKIQNLPHFKSEALLPLFEAVVNAIQAIQERVILPTGEITIKVIRENQETMDGIEIPAIVSFEITDNGIGFNSENYDSFETSDTTHKIALGGKGVGRFLWLKAFNSVYIESVFEDNNKKFLRKFSFTTTSGIKEELLEETQLPQNTTIKLNGFKEEYRKLPSAFKTTQKIAQRILEHCLSYFISNSVPKMTLVDQEGAIVLNDIFNKEIKNNITAEDILVETQPFRLSHIKLYSTHDKMHNIVLCANNRDVKPLSLSRLLGTNTQFDEADMKFTYALYVTSPYLDQTVDNYRLDFDIPEDVSLFTDKNVITQKKIKERLEASVRIFLRDFIESAKQKKEEIVAKYVATENPALRAVPQYCPEIFDEIEPNSTPEKINEVLYRHKGKAEFAIRQKSEQLLKTQTKSIEEVEKYYKALAPQLSDFQKDNLAQYLCDRKFTIELLEKKLQLNTNGKYSNEDIIHDIIFPRKTTTDELTFENHNMWLIDECLAFHNFAASDKPLNQTTESTRSDRPDIVAFAEVDDDKVARAVSIVEFKKPHRTHFDEDPTRQLYRYLREIRESKGINLPNGRQLHVADTTRYYCYAICDINDAIHEFAENNGGYARLKGELGYYTYNRALNAHTEILHFDKIVVDAKRRHKAFFEKLGI